ncbi:pre-mRNA-processing protein 40A-like [Rhododendron vialii]|uniref:pre-mRNA-processing protein 40A-like n=1 Tax=Rhododendron vialii TaxID=182163 RepID=UPI00265D64B9|nr:pre-mRNA-processing protein 40A-like [Rhododendron vialii]
MYIEFDDPMYVSMAVDLSGQLLLGQPIEVKPLNVGNPSAGERSYIPTGKKNFIDKPWDVMTLDERIDASTNWRELRDVENRRFFYNKVTGERRWSIPVELWAARNRAHEAARSSRVLAPVWTQHVPFSHLVTAHGNCQQVPLVTR